MDEPRAGGAAQDRVELGEDVREPLDEVDPDPVRVDVGVVGGEGLVDEVVDLRGHLDPRRPSPDDDERQLGLGDLVPHQGDLLEALYDAVADALGVLYTPHGQAVLFDAGDAEEVGLAA